VNFAECVTATEKRIFEELGASLAVVIVPTGLFRNEVVKALVGRADIIISRELWERFKVGKPFALFAGHPYVSINGSLISLGDYLVNGTKGVLIIPESTVEALLLLRALKEGVARSVSILFLPALCQGGPEAEVDFTAVLEGARGVAPELATIHEREVDYVRETINAIRSLSPETLAPTLFHVVAEAVEDIAEQASLPKHAIAGTLLAALIARESGVRAPTPAIASALPGLTERGVEALLDNHAEIVEAELPRVVDKLVNAAKRAIVYFNNARFEVIIDEVAARWGYTVSGFREFVNQLSNLAVSQEELKRIFSPHVAYLSTRQFPYIRREDGKLRVVTPFGDAEYIEHPAEGLILGALRDAARRYRGLVVLRGPRGVGKSTVARVALYKALGSLFLVERGGRAEVFRPVVVEVKLHNIGELSFRQIVVAANRLGLLPIFFLDPGPVHPWLIRKFIETVGNIPGAVAFVVLDLDQYEAVKDYTKRTYIIDVEEALGQKKSIFVKTLIEKYSGCTSEVAEKAKEIIVSFVDNYALVAVLAADWLRQGKCRSEEIERIMEKARHNVPHAILYYLWYGLFNGDEAMAKRHAPLLLAVGFFGPHPPKLAKAIVRAFGKEPEDAVVQWFSQPLHGILYEIMKKVAYGAVYRQFGVGGDELCHGSKEGPCRLVEICAEALVGVPRKRYSGVVEVAEEYAKLVAKALEAPGPTGLRQIDLLINDFLQAFNGMAEDGRWRIKYEAKGVEGVKTVEDVIDELDILSALFGLAMLPVKSRLLKLLEEWFFVGEKKADVIRRYLFFLLRERDEELVNRAVTIAHKVERKGGYTDMDLWRAVGIVTTGRWDAASDEELEKVLRLTVATLSRFITFSPIILEIAKPLFSETWRRVISGETRGGRKRHQRLADWLTVAAGNIAIGHPLDLLHFFSDRIDKLDLETVAQRFNLLYNVASNVGKLRLLETLFSALDWDIGGVNVAATLLGKPQSERWRAFEEVAKHVEEFVSHLDGVERAYAVARLYPRLARRYVSLGEFNKAVEVVEETIKALDELWRAYEKDRASTEKEMWQYLELMWVKPDLKEELNSLSQHVYHHVALVYMIVDELDMAIRYAERACESAKKLGDVYHEVLSCGLLLRLKTVKDGVPPIKELEQRWQRALQVVEELGVRIIATTLGEYVVALASASRLSDVEKVLEKWGWAVELHPNTSDLTYGVLSLFDGRYLEKATERLLERARADLPKLADVLHNAIEADLSATWPKIATSAMEGLISVYGKDVVKTLLDVTSTSRKLFLATLVGLAYCKNGEGWGLKLARAAARIGSKTKGITGDLFGELAKALESGAVDNCITDEVLKAVYKLYYFHV